MTDKKDTNPFSSEDSNIPHLPPSAYQPNPFPYNPTEGNPWAASNAYQQQPAYQGHAYGHGINNSSDNETQNSQQYLAMPSPSTYKTASNDSSYDFPNTYNNTSTYNPNVAYNPNAYNTNTSSEFNAYQNSQLDNGNGNKEEYDDNTTELDNSSVVNPGIETHDPDKLKISSQMLETPKSAPNIWRLFSRFVQFLASAGAFALMVAAQPATKVKTPVGVNKTAVIFVYIVSVVSVIYSFGHLIFYCVRRWGHKNKAPRWLLILVDAILGASFGTIMVFLIKDFSCKPGELNGWCDYYNSSIFFTVLAFVTYAVSFFWDIVGGFKRS